MGRYSTNTGNGDFQDPPEGTHVARCIRLIDLGTQTGEYQGKPNKRDQVLVTWELCDEMMETDDGPKPFITSKFYTNSLGEKATLRHDLVTWRGRDFSPEEEARFDLQAILGHQCMVTLTKNEKGKVKVSAVTKLPKGMEAPKPVNPLVAFWLDEFSNSTFESLSDGIKAIIQKSPEYQEAIGIKAEAQKPKNGRFDDFEDDIPF